MENILIITTKSDLRALILEVVHYVGQLQSQPVDIKPEIITGEQLCKRLSITIQTLIKWRNKGKIPYLEIGTSIRYDFNKVIAALEVVKKKR